MDDTKEGRLVAAFQALPKGWQNYALKVLEQFAEKARQHFPPPLPEPGGDYMTYKGFTAATGSTDGTALLKQEWGPWLKYYTPELKYNGMSQADLRHLDKPLLNRLRTLYNAEELSYLIPIQKVHNREVAQNQTLEEKRKAYRASYKATLRSDNEMT